MYFFSGCGLAIFVAIASSRIKNVDHVPIQELFKSRTGAMFADGHGRIRCAARRRNRFPWLPLSPFREIPRCPPRILITGLLFGLMHGAQLGWTWGLVALLTLVGVIFTFARARTGTVVASFPSPSRLQLHDRRHLHHRHQGLHANADG